MARHPGGTSIVVTVTDPVTGDRENREVVRGDYALVCAEPCHLEHTQVDFATGTVTLTIKGWRALRTPGVFTCPRCGRTSAHPVDSEQGYCGACHDWTGTPARAQEQTP